MSTYFLTTERTGLRCWTADDLPLALELWGDPQVMQFVDARGQLSEAEVRERLEREITTAENYGVQYWPAFLRESGEHIGCAGLRPHNVAAGIYELGAHLRRPYWGQGLASELGLAVISYAFGQLRAKALVAGHHPRNEISRRMLAKSGFRYTQDEFYAPTGLMHPSYLLDAGEFANATRH
jgi:RimJ/RimL family protein N-acetyltransferase